ncbi:hypothetical protein [Aeromicrobium sp. CF3.5]|uniref:hypothetical protein n=1 Tax=Aeromicrobium sp. CF3.5 TaxID=3373078 RepID=UPI003EE4F485
MKTTRRPAAPRCAALLFVAAVGLSACSGDEPESSTPVPSAAPSEPSAEEMASEVHEQYWDAYIQMSNSGEVDPALFEGVADGSVVELDLKLLGDQAEAGVRRVGEPQFGEFTTTVDGDSATSEVCYDERPWGATSDGTTVPGYAEDSTPGLMKATLADRDGSWIVTDLEFTEDASCA